MESSDSIALLELCDAFTDFMDNARYIIALVESFIVWHRFWSFPVSVSLVKRRSGELATWHFPVFGIASTVNDFGDDLVGAGFGNARVDDLALGTVVEEC